MAINTLQDYVNASKQYIEFIKTSSQTVVATIPYSVFNLSGMPLAGTIAGTTTASAILQTPTVATGYSSILFTTGQTYLTKVDFNSSVACKLRLVDRISVSGAYSYAAGTTAITSYPDISGRCPDYTSAGAVWGTRNEIWIEVTSSITSATAWQVQVTYTNQSGTTSRSSIISVAQAAAALIGNKMFQLALAAGDTGVQKIQSVIVTNVGGAAGGFNVVILRELWTGGRVKYVGDNNNLVHDILKTGMVPVYNTSALYLMVQADSTASGVPELMLELSNNG